MPVAKVLRVDSKFDCRATASLLRSGESLALASHAGALAAVICAPHARWICVASLLCWAAAVYFAVRVRVDAALFELLAEDATASALGLLDNFLTRAGLKSKAVARGLDERRTGAIGLWRNLAAAVALQLLLLGAAVVLQ